MAVVVAVCTAGSPSVAAAILSVASWHWLFLINVPIGARRSGDGGADAARTPRVTSAARSFERRAQRADFRTPHRRRQPDRPERDVACGAHRIRRGRRDSASRSFGGNSSSPRRCCRSIFCARPVFALSLATSISSFGAQSLAIVSLPFYFEDRLGHSATTTGLLLTPWPVATALIAPIAGTAGRPFPSRPPWQHRPSGDGKRAGSRRPRDRRFQSGLARLAARDLRPGLWILPVAQQPGDHRQRAARAKRRSGRPAIVAGA